MNYIISRRTLIIIIFILLLGNIILGVTVVSRGRELDRVQSVLVISQQNKNILSFQKLFVEKVLDSDGAVDYDTRKLLDQTVGSTNNRAVIDAWNAFVSAKTETDAQGRVKGLLSVIADQVYEK